MARNTVGNALALLVRGFVGHFLVMALDEGLGWGLVFQLRGAVWLDSGFVAIQGGEDVQNLFGSCFN